MSGLGSRHLVLDRVLASLSVVGASFFGAGLTGAGALEPGPISAAAATQNGWWNQLPPPAGDEAARNTLRPALPALPAPPAVPAGAIVTSAAADQVDKVAAVGLELALPGGVQLETVQVAPPAASRLQPQATLTRHLAGFWEDLPTSTALLIPVAFGLALLVGLALGPSGRPEPAGQRAGGLSRALDRRRGGEGVI